MKRYDLSCHIEKIELTKKIIEEVQLIKSNYENQIRSYNEQLVDITECLQSANKTSVCLAQEKIELVACAELLQKQLNEVVYEKHLLVKSGFFANIGFMLTRFLKKLKSSNKINALALSKKPINLKYQRVLLTESPKWVSFKINEGQVLSLYATTSQENIKHIDDKKALLLVKCYDSDNDLITEGYGNLSFSQQYLCNFVYLKNTNSGIDKILSITMPIKTKRIEVGFVAFFNNLNEYTFIGQTVFFEKLSAVKYIVSEKDIKQVEMIELEDEFGWGKIQVAFNDKIDLFANVKYPDGVESPGKHVLLLVQYLDVNGKHLSDIYGKMPYSELKKAHFYYVDDTNDSHKLIGSFVVSDIRCQYLCFKVVPFGIKNKILISQNICYTKKALTNSNNRQHVTMVSPLLQSFIEGNRLKTLKQIKVAVILDEFSYNSFKDTFTPVIIEPNNWQLVFENEKPDIFFCESAWSGTDNKTRPWKGQVYASVNFKNENRKSLLAIIDYCKKNNIPTVFWNKEDPTHFTDRVHDFVKTAQLFDYVFTTAQECVSSYKKEYGLKNVYCLPFATNPKLFNPIEKYQRTNDVIFAGSWYQNHIERSEDMVKIFDAILESNIGLVIHDRYYGDSDPLHKYPETYLPYVKPNVPFNEIDKVYKGSVFGLNINTVKESETMFARRVFELMSSNTLVLSNESKGIKSLFGSNVIFIDNDPQVLENLSAAEINRIRAENLHNVLANHTYRNRFKTILQKIGYKYENDDSSLTICSILNTVEDAQLAVDFYRKQLLKNAKLLFIISMNIADIDVAEIYSKFNGGDIEVISISYNAKYGVEDYNITTTHCAFVDYSKTDFNIHLLEDALLHSSYLEDEFILLNDGDQYKLIDEAKLENIIVKAEYFEYICKNYGKTVKNKFYSLNGN